MAKLHLTETQVAELRRLWTSGLRRDEIAAEVGLTIDSLASAKAALGLPRLPPRGRRKAAPDPTPAEITAACEEIRSGWSPEEHAVRQGYAPLGDAETEAARKHRIVSISEVVATWES